MLAVRVERGSCAAPFRTSCRTFAAATSLRIRRTGVAPGGFHRLDVRVKRRGLTVKARPGYIGVEPAK